MMIDIPKTSGVGEEFERLRLGLEQFGLPVRRAVVEIIAKRVLLSNIIEYFERTEQKFSELAEMELTEEQEWIAVGIASFYLASTDAYSGSIVAYLTEENVQSEMIKLIRFTGDER